MSYIDDSGEQCCLNGICNDCGAQSKKWTREEIAVVKDDLGMGDDDDFCDWCEECTAKYVYITDNQFSESSYANEFFNNFLMSKPSKYH